MTTETSQYNTVRDSCNGPGASGGTVCPAEREIDTGNAGTSLANSGNVAPNLLSLTAQRSFLEYGHSGGFMTSNGRSSRSILNLMTVGTTLVACIVVGYLLGSYLDRKLGTSPWLVLVGVVLGTAAGFVGLFRMVSQNLK
jgi:ATP synthase protein I